MPVFGEAETPNGDASDGPQQFKDFCSRDSHHLPSSLMSSSFPITLKFIDITYKVKLERKKSSSIKNIFTHAPSDQRSTVQEKTILNGITGMVSPGEILAVLGPSGSGKSTLLNALAGRLQSNSFTGSVLANDKRVNRTVTKRTGFVTQGDVLYPHLTVRETLIFCSLLRLPNSLTKCDKISVVDSVISELGLAKCEDTIIGNSFIKGVSGGERKRVSIAHEMLINPSLLLLDEPTSGLDSTAAHRLVNTLCSLAQKGKTIVTSVHQPSSRVYQMFDSVLVLSEGRCLYFGKGSEAMSYFESVGFSPSFPVNPADFLLDLANGVCQVDGLNDRDKPNIKQLLVSSYYSSLAPRVKAACMETATLACKETVKITNHAVKERIRGDHAGFSNWFNQFNILLQRSLKERRHESFNSLRVFQVLAAAVLAGTMWWHSRLLDVQDRLGLLFFFSIFWGVFPSFNAVFAFPQERTIFIKEKASGMYTLSSYFMARITGDLPMELILPTVFLTMTYWMAGLKPELGAFLLTLIPFFLTWIKYISITFYSYRLLIYLQYGDGESISSMLGCFHQGRNSASCRFIEEDIGGQMHPA
ncbi:ABC transporter-like, ATP-binding domain, partial [Dillenia turbinata]